MAAFTVDATDERSGSGVSTFTCGSMFASSVTECMIQGWLSEDDYDDLAEVQGMALGALESAVHKTLLKRHNDLGHEHSTSFSDQDDAWFLRWLQYNLPAHGKDLSFDPGELFNRDPGVPQERGCEDPQRLEKAHVAAGGDVSSLYGGSIDAMRNQVVKMGRRYLKSTHSMTDAAPNHSLHSSLVDIFGRKENRPEEIEGALVHLTYRMEVMSTADCYLELMGVPYPNGQRCHEYDESKTWEWRPKQRSREHLEMWRERVSILFPETVQEQGLWFSRGPSYLGTAFFVAGLSEDVIQQKLEALVAIIEKHTKEQSLIVKELPEVKEKCQKLWQVLGKDGNISPKK